MLDKAVGPLFRRRFDIAISFCAVISMLSISSLASSQCSNDCDFSQLSYKTDVLELNLERIKREIRAYQRQEEQLFNELQLVRFNYRLGSIQRKEISTNPVNNEKSALNGQRYPNEEKLAQVEKKSSELSFNIEELEASASRLEREIQRINQLNGLPGNVSSEIFDEGIMINVVDSDGKVLATGHCTGVQCRDPQTVAVDVTEPGTYYLRLLSGSPTKAWLDSYELKAIAPKGREVLQSEKPPVLIHLGETVLGRLHKKEDSSEYLVDIEDAGDFRLKMSSELASASGWKVTISNEDKDVLAVFQCDSTDCKEGKSFLFTPKSLGRHQLSVESGSDFSVPSGSFSVQLFSVASQKNEVEPNDKAPQKLAFGEGLTGSISDVNDLDHYSIEVLKPGRLTVNLTGRE